MGFCYLDKHENWLITFMISLNGCVILVELYGSIKCVKNDTLYIIINFLIFFLVNGEPGVSKVEKLYAVCVWHT